MTSHRCLRHSVRLHRLFPPVAGTIESGLGRSPAGGHGEPPYRAGQNARVVGGWQERICITHRTDERRDRFHRINHSRRTAGVENIGRQQAWQIVGRPARLYRCGQVLRRAADGHDEDLGKAAQLHESRAHIERLDVRPPAMIIILRSGFSRSAATATDQIGAKPVLVPTRISRLPRLGRKCADP